MSDDHRVLLLGPPGAGKGTQAARLADEYGLEHITTGDALRQNKEMETEYGTPGEYMDAGELVPDPVVNEIVVAALEQADGFVLDGYPRNLDQAEFLSEQTDLDHVVKLSVPEGELVDRLTGRRVCDDCGGDLVQREDDTEETVRERLEVYRENTEPVVEHYRDAGALVEVDGEGTPDEVFGRIRDVIEG